jgi:TolB protein
MNTDGSDQTRLTDNPALDVLPSWSPNSQQIGFVSDRTRKGQLRLYVMNADGSHVRALTHGNFDMSPDWNRG